MGKENKNSKKKIIMVIVGIVGILLIGGIAIGGGLFYLGINSAEYRVLKGIEYLVEGIKQQENQLVSLNDASHLAKYYAQNGLEIEGSCNLSTNLIGNMTIGIDNQIILDKEAEEIALYNTLSVMNMELGELNLLANSEQILANAPKVYNGCLGLSYHVIEERMRDRGYPIEISLEYLFAYLMPENDMEIDNLLKLIDKVHLEDTKVVKNWQVNNEQIDTDEIKISFDEEFFSEELGIGVSEVLLYLDQNNYIRGMVIPKEKQQGMGLNSDIIIQFLGEEHLLHQVHVMLGKGTMNLVAIYDYSYTKNNQEYQIEVELFEQELEIGKIVVTCNTDSVLGEYDVEINYFTEGTGEIVNFSSYGELEVKSEENNIDIEIYNAALTVMNKNNFQLTGKFSFDEKNREIVIPEATYDIGEASEAQIQELYTTIVFNIIKIATGFSGFSLFN